MEKILNQPITAKSGKIGEQTMSRWIDADHLRRWMIARWQESDPYTDRPFRADEILAQIDRELSIDIVRCGECKWYNCGACFRDDGANNERSAYDFCSYGERKNDERYNIDAE